MLTVLVNTGIRLEGTPKEIDEHLKRLNYLLPYDRLKRYPSQTNPKLELAYLQIYVPPFSPLLDEVQSSNPDIQRLLDIRRELAQRNQQLKEKIERLHQIPLSDIAQWVKNYPL